MPAYLKIENIGVCPPEGFTVLGVSLADTSDNQGVIGQFGSGNKHGIAVCLRNNVAPVVFCGTLRLDFFTKPQTVADSKASKDFARVCVKYGGTDPVTGANRSATEDLGFVLDYGKQDWSEVALALREFVSNAIDRSIREDGDWRSVKIEIVDETRVRAKRDHTRVFIPLTPEVLDFFNNLGRWFLHFSEPESLEKAILPKKNRNLGDRIPNERTLANATAYLANWLAVLKSDNRAIFTAATAASAAADFVLSFSRAVEPEESEAVGV